MKAHIGVDANSGLVHKVVGAEANVNDMTQAHALVLGEEADVLGDAGYKVMVEDARHSVIAIYRAEPLFAFITTITARSSAVSCS